MSIVDMASVWFIGNIYEQDYSQIKLGQELVLGPRHYRGRNFLAV